MPATRMLKSSAEWIAKILFMDPLWCSGYIQCHNNPLLFICAKHSWIGAFFPPVSAQASFILVHSKFCLCWSQVVWLVIAISLEVCRTRWLVFCFSTVKDGRRRSLKFGTIPNGTHSYVQQWEYWLQAQNLQLLEHCWWVSLTCSVFLMCREIVTIDDRASPLTSVRALLMTGTCTVPVWYKKCEADP